jgi:hypothetical protein
MMYYLGSANDEGRAQLCRIAPETYSTVQLQCLWLPVELLYAQVLEFYQLSHDVHSRCHQLNHVSVSIP